jgi:hypothetical protein
MQVTLINSVNGKDVHGTDTGKRTGCGINLTRADNISKYTKGGIMVDLKEITCEKCKLVLAKRIIKESQKELSRELKEESKRVTAQGLSPVEKESEKKISIIGKVKSKVLGETEVIQPRTFGDESYPNNEVKQSSVMYSQPKVNDNAPKQVTPTYNQPQINENAAKPMTQTVNNKSFVNEVHTSSFVAKDDILAQFAIKVPKVEPEPEPEQKVEQKPEPTSSKVMLSGLSQFAISVPKVEEKRESVIPKEMLEDELDQFAVPTPKAEEKPAPVAMNTILDEELEELAIPTPKVEEKPAPVAVNAILDEELEELAIPTPKAEEKLATVAVNAILDEELEELAISSPKAEEKPFNIDGIDDIMITPAKVKADADKKAEEMSDIEIKLEDLDLSVMDEIPQVKPEPVAPQVQPTTMANQPAQIPQADVQVVNAHNTQNAQQIVYNDEGQPLYPVFNEKGQLFYTSVAPTNVQSEPEPGVDAKEDDLGINQAANPAIVALIAANAKKKLVLDETGVAKPTEPIIDSVEAALSQLGANIDENKSKEPVPIFTEYKPPSRKSAENTQIRKPENKVEQNASLTRAELRRQKKLEKINSEFEKKLRERGFDLDESKRKKRAVR